MARNSRSGLLLILLTLLTCSSLTQQGNGKPDGSDNQDSQDEDSQNTAPDEDLHLPRRQSWWTQHFHCLRTRIKD